MGQKVLSICVEQKYIRICEVSKDAGKGATLTNAFCVKTPAASYDDGFLTDASKVAEVIAAGIRDKNLMAKKVLFSINSKKIATKEVLIPYVKGQKKIRQILETNNSEYFPMSNVEDYVFGYNLIDVVEEEGIKKHRVYAIAAPKEMVSSYYQLAEALQMEIENIDYYGNSVLQMLELQAPTGVSLALQIVEDATYVNILKNGCMVLQRSVPYGKNAVVGALIDIKGMDEKQARMLVENKELLDQSIQPEEYMEALRYFVNSIVRIVEYFGSMYKDVAIDNFKIFGTGSNIAGIEEILSREIGIQATKIENLKYVTVKGKALENKQNALDYIQNIGAVIKPIGLVLEIEDPKMAEGQIDRYFYMGMIGAAIIAIAWCAVSALTYFGLEDKKTDLSDNIAQIQDIETIVNDYNSAIASYQTLSDFYASTENPNEEAARFLRDLELVMPTSAGIGNLSMSSGAVNLSASCTGKLDVAEMIIQLKKLSYVTDVYVSNMTETLDESGVATTNFNLVCTLSKYMEPDVSEDTADTTEGGVQ